MMYMKVKWNHTGQDQPIMIYSEVDHDSWEVRKVEVFPNGDLEYAGPDAASKRTELSVLPLPNIEAIAADPVFEPVEIGAQEFEQVWEKACGNLGHKKT